MAHNSPSKNLDKVLDDLKLNGNKQYSLGKHTAAIATYTEAIIMIPTPTPDDYAARLSILYSNRALCQRALENWNDVETDSLLSIQYDKYNAKAHYMVGLCLCRKEDWLPGIRSLEKALDTAKRQKRPPSLLKEFEGAIAAGRYAWHAASIKDDQLLDTEFASYLDQCMQYIKEKALEDIRMQRIKESSNPLLLTLPEDMKEGANTVSVVTPAVAQSNATLSSSSFVSLPSSSSLISSSSSSSSFSSVIPPFLPILQRPRSSLSLTRPSTAVPSSRPGTASTVSRYLAVVEPSSEGDTNSSSSPTEGDTNSSSSSSSSSSPTSVPSSSSSSTPISPLQLLHDTLEQHYLSRTSSLSELFAERETSRTKRKIPDFFLCPITCELMLDPVITPGGHSYERLPLEHYLKNVKNEDPQTRQTLQVSQLVSNISLKSAIQYFLTENPWAHPQLPRDPVTGQVSVTGIGPSSSSSSAGGNNGGN